MILAYVLFVVLACAYFLVPAAIEQTSSHVCVCSSEGASQPREVRKSETKEAESNAVMIATMKISQVATTEGFKFGSTFLLILIPILPASSGSRDLVRSTWYRGYGDSEDVMLRFVMGVNGLDQSMMTQLQEENERYGDIVFITDFTESTQALTNKTIAMMKWASDNVNFTYMMKCDDDTYVYVDNVISELKRRPRTTRLYYGVMAMNTTPIADPTNKWYDTTWNLSAVYLPYARGGGYILSHDLILLLAKQSKRLKWHLNEDVSVGSWLAAFDYERRDDELFCYTSYGQNLHPCRHDYHIAHLFHGLPKRKLKHLFHELYYQHRFQLRIHNSTAHI